MNTAVYILVVLSLLVIIGLLFFGIVYRSAKNDMQSTFVPSGEIKFITAGEDVKEVIANVPGKTYDFDRDELVDGVCKVPWFLEKWGIVWVSLFYPLKRVHLYNFEYDELQADTHPTTKEVSYTIVHRTYKDVEAVNSLYWRYPYPVLAQDIKLEGNFQIKVLVTVTFEVIKPVYLIFVLKGNWMPFATSAVIGLIEAYSKGMTFDQFRMAVADNTQIGSLAQKLSGAYVLDKSVRIAEAALITFDLSGSSEKIREANTAIERAELEAKAAVKTAEGTRQTKVLEAQGEAEAIRLKGEAEAEVLRMSLTNAGPDAAKVLVAREYSLAISQAKPKFLTLGGNGPLATVSSEETKPSKEKETP